jgi:TonB-dependent receptor-like protein
MSHRNVALVLSYLLVGVASADAQLLQSERVAVIEITVTAETRPVPQVQVIVSGMIAQTDANGRLTLQVASGPIEIIVVKEGFNPVTVMATAIAGQSQAIPIPLERQTTIEEHVTVSATRTDKRIEDQPMRVEVLDAEEIEEKQLMTPSDIVMMLNEMGGLRVQATSPSLGAASVRVQGMRGRYTRFLSDGLPLFGSDVGGLGLLQISAHGPGNGRGDQGRGVRALWRRRSRWRRRPDFQAPHHGFGARRAAQPDKSRWNGCGVVCGATTIGPLERHVAHGRALAATQRSGRRRLGRSGRLLERCRASSPVLER